MLTVRCSEAPLVLCLHLKRYAFDGAGGRKLKAAITFEVALDLTEYTTDDTTDAVAGKGSNMYHLYAVLVHRCVSCSPSTGSCRSCRSSRLFEYVQHL